MFRFVTAAYSGINRYLDKISELDTDSTLKIAKDDSGGIFGIVNPMHWDMRRGKRRKLVVMSFVFCGYWFCLCSLLKSSYDFINYDVSVSAFICFIILVAIISVMLNIFSVIKRRTFTEIYLYIDEDFFKYDDFPNDFESRNKENMKKRIKFVKNIMLWVYFNYTALVIFFFLDNLQRDSDSIPTWMNQYLLIPFYVPFDTSHLVLIVGINIFLLTEGNFLIQTIYGAVVMYISVLNRHLAEVEALTEASRKLEERAIKLFKTQNEDVDISKMDRYHLYQNQEFLKIYKFCMRKIIKHHQIVYSFGDRISEYYNVLTFCMIYSSGPLIAFSIYGALEYDMFRDELYFTPWIHADTSLKRTLRIMLTRLQKPVTIKAAYIEASLDHAFIETMVKVCYSYIGLIHMMKGQTVRG